MIGNVRIIADTRPHCTNGWEPTPTHPSCNYTGGHFCELLANHEGPCRCTCGSTTTERPPDYLDTTKRK